MDPAIQTEIDNIREFMSDGIIIIAAVAIIWVSIEELMHGNPRWIPLALKTTGIGIIAAVANKMKEIVDALAAI